MDNVDWAGVAHAPASAPRIASLVPSLTELLFDLGVGDRVVARTGFCVHPKGAVERARKIGGTKDPDLDLLRALAPTHLVVNVDENRRDVVDAARAFVPHVVVTHPLRPDDNPRLFALMAAIFGGNGRADALAADYAAARGELAAAVAPLPRERVLYLIWRKPWMTVARETYIAATLAQAGLDTVPVDAASRYPEIADDDRAWTDAQRILLSTEPYAFRPRDAVALAARHGRPVALVDGEWTSWYGSRAAPGLRQLAAWRRQQAAAGA